jgi:hypothetical protein
VKLKDIVNSSAAWETLSKLKKNPKLAYRLLKYQKKVADELDVCTKHRDKLGRELSGDAPDAPWTIKANTPEAQEFHARFNEFLQGDSDLAWVGLTMDELIDALDAEKGNVLSEEDLEALEPFFTKPEEKVAA